MGDIMTTQCFRYMLLSALALIASSCSRIANNGNDPVDIPVGVPHELAVVIPVVKLGVSTRPIDPEELIRRRARERLGSFGITVVSTHINPDQLYDRSDTPFITITLQGISHGSFSYSMIGSLSHMAPFYSRRTDSRGWWPQMYSTQEGLTLDANAEPSESELIALVTRTVDTLMDDFLTDYLIRHPQLHERRKIREIIDEAK